MGFRERSHAVSKNFLQSVVVFDDLARLEEPRLEKVEELPAEAPEQEEEVDRYGAPPEQLAEPSEAETLPSGEGGVDVKRLSDAFAEKGLICGFLKPTADSAQDEEALLLDAARRADIVILDWVINRDEGETCRGLISRLLRTDREQEEQRLRLIAIYTSQSDLNTIVDRVAETLEEVTGQAPDRSDYVLTVGACQIVVFAKETSAVAGEAEGRRVSEEELPQRLIEAFAEFTMGLVPNVVLAGLAAIRTDTHRVLRVLDHSLDPAYVGQRLLLKDPGEAEEQLVELLASELRSVMEDRQVGREADRAAVEDWVELQLEKGELPFWQGVDPAQANDEREALLGHGMASAEQPVVVMRGRAEIKKATVHKAAARAFVLDPADGDKANEELAMRFALRTHYSNPDRVLQLGTVIRVGSEYFLCVQPVCDSLRIDGEREFPFLPLAENDDKFDLVVRDSSGQRLKLFLARKPHTIRFWKFRADAGKRCVVAARDGNEYVFTDTANAKVIWVARLQDAHGQRVVHGLGADFGRVGLSESEWLRTISGQED